LCPDFGLAPKLVSGLFSGWFRHNYCHNFVAVLGGGLQGHGQHALDGSGLAGQRQLADEGEGAGAVEGDLAAAQEHSQGDGQVEPTRIFLQVGRG
jgi:hypothetical protein